MSPLSCCVTQSRNPRRSQAQRLRKLAAGLRESRTAFNVFTEGNSKLPFYSWSTLPQWTCPGAGDCLRFCYSFRAWRYPAAFCRQLQNTLLLRIVVS